MVSWVPSHMKIQGNEKGRRRGEEGSQRRVECLTQITSTPKEDFSKKQVGYTTGIHTQIICHGKEELESNVYANLMDKLNLKKLAYYSS